MNEYNPVDVELLKSERDKLKTELEEIKRAISDPGAVWANMLRGTIARPQALEHYEKCKAALETAERERDEARRQAAAMREALCKAEPVTGAWESVCYLCGAKTEVGDITHKKTCPFSIAKCSDAGRDLVPLSDVDPLLECVRDIMCEYDDGYHVSEAACAGCKAQKVLKAWDAKHPAKP